MGRRKAQATEVQPIEEPIKIEIQETPPQSGLVFEKEYFDVLKNNGLDVSKKGTWQMMYAYYLDKVFNLRGRQAVDLGCAMGAIPAAMSDYGVKATGVDISEYAIQNSPFKNINLVRSDISNFDKPENTFNFIHSMHTMNLLTPEQCDKVFANIKKIAAPDAVFFAIMTMKRGNDDAGAEGERTKQFWDALASKYQMLDQFRLFYPRLMSIYVPGWEFMVKYKWPFVVYQIKK